VPVTGVLPNETSDDDRPAEHWRTLLGPPSLLVSFDHAVWGGEALLTATIDELGRTWAGVFKHGLQAYGRRWRLSPGQLEVVHLSLQGVERAQLARAIHISEDGLKWRIKGLLRKCGARNLHDAVLNVVSECLVYALTLETSGVFGVPGATSRHGLVAPLALVPAEMPFEPDRLGAEDKGGLRLAVDPR
jgi:DNA-binding CsgD family transcriptional regulator